MRALFFPPANKFVKINFAVAVFVEFRKDALLISRQELVPKPLDHIFHLLKIQFP